MVMIDGLWHLCDATEGKIEKYEKVIKSIEDNDLDKKNDLKAVKTYIEDCQDILDKINGDSGFGY